MTVDYYEILDVAAHATQEQIRSSFRRKVMEHHPDRNPHAKEQSEAEVRVVIEAYRILSDPEQRLAHDRRMGSGAPVETDAFGDRLRSRTHDPGAQSRLVLHELLEGNGPRAVEIYESLQRDYVYFDLLPYLSLKDYLDCKFLLAEEYERQGNLRVALEMYKEVYKEELELPRLCFFFDEVKIRLRNLYCRNLVRGVAPEVALGYYCEALEGVELSKADKALICKRMADCYYRLGDLESARAALREAFHHHPKLKGSQRICQKLGMTPLRSA